MHSESSDGSTERTHNTVTCWLFVAEFLAPKRVV